MRRLLARQLEGEFAIADAAGKAFRVLRSGFFAIGRDELGEGGKKAALCQTVAVNALEASFSPSFLQITERDLLLLVIGARIPSSMSARQNAHDFLGLSGSLPPSFVCESHVSMHL